MENFGGNIVRSIDMTKTGRQDFASGPYDYYMTVVEDGNELEIKQLNSFTAYFLDVLERSPKVFANNQIELVQGDVLQLDMQTVKLSVNGGSVRFLISGVKEYFCREPQMSITHYKDIYKVEKPWGHELWLNREHPAYCLKQVSLKAGFRTSLQYHTTKQETNVIFEGEAYIHYKSNSNIENNDVQETDIDRTIIKPISSVDISPNVVHRLESIKDCVLYETSTPQLNDVIRIEDDTNRSNGRVESEHKA